MIDPVNNLYNQLSQYSQDLGVIGKLVSGHKLKIVSGESGPKLDISEKGIFQGLTRTVERLGNKTLATAQDTLSYIHKLNDRTLNNIASLQNPSNLSKDQLKNFISVIKELNTQMRAALTGLASLEKSYEGKTTKDGKSISELIENEKMRLNLTLEESQKTFVELNRELALRIKMLLPELESLQEHNRPELFQMSVEDASKHMAEVNKKKEEFQKLLYARQNVNNPEDLKEAQDIVNGIKSNNQLQTFEKGFNEEKVPYQFAYDFHRWRSVDLNGTEWQRLEKIPSKKEYEKRFNEEIVDAIGYEQTVLFCPLVTQTFCFKPTEVLDDEYKKEFAVTGQGTNVSINIDEKNVHIELKTNYTLRDREEGAYICSRIVKREVTIPIEDLNQMVNKKPGEIKFPNMTLIDSYSREIPDADLARELIKFA
jgi:hypothetical protein